MNAPLATFALLIVILVLLILPSPTWRMILLVAGPRVRHLGADRLWVGVLSLAGPRAVNGKRCVFLVALDELRPGSTHFEGDVLRCLSTETRPVSVGDSTMQLCQAHEREALGETDIAGYEGDTSKYGPP